MSEASLIERVESLAGPHCHGAFKMNKMAEFYNLFTNQTLHNT